MSPGYKNLYSLVSHRRANSLLPSGANGSTNSTVGLCVLLSCCVIFVLHALRLLFAPDLHNLFSLTHTHHHPAYNPPSDRKTPPTLLTSHTTSLETTARRRSANITGLVRYPVAECDGITAGTMVNNAECYIMDSEEAAIRNPKYQEYCRRCLMSIALGVICTISGKAYERCRRMKASGCTLRKLTSFRLRTVFEQVLALQQAHPKYIPWINKLCDQRGNRDSRENP